MEGLIFLYRKISDWGWYKTRDMSHLFLHLIIKANFKDRIWQDTLVKRGQLITSRNKLSEETGVPEKVVRTILKRLQKTGEIVVETTNKYSLITICNYDKYQYIPQNEDRYKTNEGPAEGHRRATKEKRKKENKEGGTNVPSSSLSATTDKDINLLAFMEFFNRTMQEHHAQIPTITQISGKRKQALLARLKEHGKENLRTAVINAAKSPFLNGASEKPFFASFDWIFRPNNFPKVLEGNYNHEILTSNNSYGHGTTQQLTAQQRIEKSLQQGAEYFADMLARNEASLHEDLSPKVW